MRHIAKWLETKALAKIPWLVWLLPQETAGG